MTYSELTRQPSISRRLRLALDGMTLLTVIGCVSIGIVLYASRTVIGFRLASDEASYTVVQTVCVILAAVLPLIGLVRVWQRFTWVDRFFEYSARVVREAYIRSGSVETIVRVDNILRDALDREGLIRWRFLAEDQLYGPAGPLGPMPARAADAPGTSRSDYTTG